MQVGEVAGFGGEGDLARMLLHVGDEGFNVVELLVGGVAQESRGIIHEGHANGAEVVRQGVVVHAHELRDGSAAVIEHIAIAVIGIFTQIVKGNGAGAAAHVGNDHVPAKFLVEGGGQRAGVGVGVSAGVRGHDQLDGALRPFSQRGAAHEYEHECENESHNFLHSDGSSLSFLGLLPFLPFYMQISRQLDNHFQKNFNRLFF